MIENKKAKKKNKFLLITFLYMKKENLVLDFHCSLLLFTLYPPFVNRHSSGMKKGNSEWDSQHHVNSLLGYMRG